MDLLQSGVPRSVIALWLGHESVETTQIYLDATLAMKEQVLAKMSPLHGKARRFRPTDQLLAWFCCNKVVGYDVGDKMND
ncbi:integrase [Paraburkholderia sediminicola]|nr:integrase [Paraburkholderia sediminicola]